MLISKKTMFFAATTNMSKNWAYVFTQLYFTKHQYLKKTENWGEKLLFRMQGRTIGVDDNDID